MKRRTTHKFKVSSFKSVDDSDTSKSFFLSAAASMKFPISQSIPIHKPLCWANQITPLLAQLWQYSPFISANQSFPFFPWQYSSFIQANQNHSFFPWQYSPFLLLANQITPLLAQLWQYSPFISANQITPLFCLTLQRERKTEFQQTIARFYAISTSGTLRSEPACMCQHQLTALEIYRYSVLEIYDYLSLFVRHSLYPDDCSNINGKYNCTYF